MWVDFFTCVGGEEGLKRTKEEEEEEEEEASQPTLSFCVPDGLSTEGEKRRHS